jgi:hypothetical protein
MAQVRIGQVDLATGELLENATLAVFFPKRRNGFTEGWIAMAQDALMKLALAPIGDQARRVLLALLSMLDFENYLSVHQADLARKLGMKRPNVSRAIARLVEEGVLLPGPRIANRATHTLNPRYGWKGSARNHQDALSARMRARGLSVVGEGAASAPEGDLSPPG